MAPAAPVPHLDHFGHRRPWRRWWARTLERVALLVALPIALLASSMATGAAGVLMRTGTRAAPAVPLRVPASTFFVVGITERGDTAAPVELRGMGDYNRHLGNWVSYGALYDQLRTFFELGGSRAYVARTVGAAATTGTLVLVDQSAGAGLPTLTINAANPGPWSAGLTVERAAGTLADTFRLILRLGTFTPEVYDNLASPAAAVQALTASKWARGVANANATPAPNNNPRVLAPTALSAGTDDRAAIVTGTYTAALDRFTADLGPGLVAIPGQPIDTVGAALRAHAAANRRTAALAEPVGTADAEYVADGLAFAAAADGEVAGLFGPWVVIEDSGVRRTISPEGAVAGVRARAFDNVGPWQAPMGAYGIMGGPVVDVERRITDPAAADALAAAGVSAIRVIGRRVRLYDYLSLSADKANWDLLTHRELLNHVTSELADDLEDVVGGTIDSQGRLQRRAEKYARGICGPIKDAGGLYPWRDPVTGDQLDDGFTVDAGEVLNPLTELEANRLHVQVALRPSPTARVVDTLVMQAQLRATV